MPLDPPCHRRRPASSGRIGTLAKVAPAVAPSLRGMNPHFALRPPRGRIRRIPAAGFGRRIEGEVLSGSPSPTRDQRRWRPLPRPAQSDPRRGPARGLPRPSGGRRPAASDAETGRSEALDRRTREIGRELFDRIGRGPKPWRRAWWDDRFMAADPGRPHGPGPALPVHRRPARPEGRRIDPAAPGRVPRRGRRRGPLVAGSGRRLAPEGTTREEWLAEAARTAAGVMARKFIAGATPDEALQTVLGLRRRRLAFTADLLGEAIISEAEADWYQQTCLAMIRGLAGPLAVGPRGPPDRPRPARPDPAGQPLAQAVEPDRPLRADPRRGDSIDRAAGRLRPILRTARERGAYVHVDMEQYAYRP